ncbi:MAG: enoyl-CoA hydratase/isomerase family protein [Betaproteobacteria bacterium]|nr:enoyl-CoA hydratase/isomerase family protein [Betaproteobacteria bacterium]
MQTTSNYERRGDTALLYLNNPPVNALGRESRTELADNLQRALDDLEIKTIVVAGAGKMFCGGADIKAFNTHASRAEPSSRAIMKQIEAATKPVIAAIHGNALGLGLELAMACHYRVAASDAKLGLPEVKLGLLPGGGGTQRLPRLVGVEAALTMITEGEPVDATKARQLGLVDEIIEGDLAAGAVEFARRTAARREHPVASRRSVSAERSNEIVVVARAEFARRKRGFQAPRECIACIEAAVTLPFDEGLKFERERFDVLVKGFESKALRHLFFAERAAAKIADVPENTPTRPIRQVAVLGAGTMGGGIAMCCANAGIPVLLLEAKPEALERGLSTIGKNYASTVAKGRIAQAEADRRMGLIRGTLDYARVGDADLVVEAVFEDMGVKKEVFSRLDAICKAGAILATNTSRLDINQIAGFTSRPQDVIGLHFFSPANVMRLVEVVRGKATSAEVIASSMKLARQIKKLPVLVSVCDGFVGNRMVAQYAREAEFLLEEGATPQQVDGALYDFGLAMGRFAMSDLAGLDISWASRKRLASTRRPELRYSKVADRICELGRFGQKTGAGFYRYEPGSRTPIPDPEIGKLIIDCATQAGIERRTITNEEIIERTIYALVNESAKILEEGIAQRASDIDLIYVNGYGFPAWRGGPTFHADTVGLDKVYARVCEFEQRHGEYWRPAPLLKRLAQTGKTFSQREQAARQPRAEVHRYA